MTVLGDHGRFLEIGKRDIYADTRMPLRTFRKNLSFMAIDLDRALRELVHAMAEHLQWRRRLRPRARARHGRR